MAKKQTKKEKKGKKERKWFLPEETREMLKERFAELTGEVRLEVFTKDGENDPFNGLTILFCTDIARLSDKITVHFNTIEEEKSIEYDVTRSPSVLFNPEKYRIRYTGAPAGEEGRSFIETLFMVSSGDSGLTPESREALAALEEERHIEVFVTPGCPYCPGQVLNAFRAAIERPDLVSAECVEATEYPDLAKKYNVGSVPHTVINGELSTLGLEPEGRFVSQLITLEAVEEAKPPGEMRGADTVEVDVIIVGAGPAGLTAGIYAKRSGLEAVILEKEVVGGQVAVTPMVDNYPGFQNIAGKKLMDMIHAQAREYVPILEGVEVEEVKVGKNIEAITGAARFVGKALILTTGTQHRKLGVPGEDKFYGHGVSYCATCDGYMYKDKKVLMVGGGNTALTDALYLKSLGADVTIAHRRDEFRAEKALQESVEREGVEVIWDATVEEVLGKDMVVGARLKNTKSDKTKDFEAEGVFVAIGELPNNERAQELGLKLTDEGYIKVDRSCRTNLSRIYAAGDITGGVRQIVTAVSEGATAALAAFEDISKPYWKR